MKNKKHYLGDIDFCMDDENTTENRCDAQNVIKFYIQKDKKHK